MFTRPLFRALAALPVCVATLTAQHSTSARDATRSPSVALAPAGARRDTTARSGPVVPMPSDRHVSHSGDDQITAFVFTLGAMAIGGAAGSIHRDPCFGDGERMSGRALLSGFAIGIPVSMLVTRMADREAASPAPSHPSRFHVPIAIGAPLAGASIGAALGAPIGAVQGARHPERCGGSLMGGTGKGTAQMAVGGAVVGAGVAALVGTSALVEHLRGNVQERQDSVDALARRARIRPDTLRGRQSSYTAAQLSFVVPGAGHVRAGETRRGLLLGALTYGVGALAYNAAPRACAEGAGPERCTRAEKARMTTGMVATGLAWALTVADGYAAAERHNERVVERAVGAMQTH